jgi:DNA-directed RNA polymerase subunit N (RpoN/RPB10)
LQALLAVAPSRAFTCGGVGAKWGPFWRRRAHGRM